MCQTLHLTKMGRKQQYLNVYVISLINVYNQTVTALGGHLTLTTKVDNEGGQIMVILNLNQDTQEPAVTNYFAQLGMTDLNPDKHSNAKPPTNQRGSTPIIGLFVTPGLLGSACTYLGGFDAVPSNHWLLPLG